jgi:hypothetical protein
MRFVWKKVNRLKKKFVPLIFLLAKSILKDASVKIAITPLGLLTGS